MINIDALTIKAFLKENREFFIDARVQKIQQPNRREIIFHLRNYSESKKFYININPSFYHICFMSKENESKRSIKIPKSAAMFCMLLRKYIEGAKIVEVTQPDYERIIELHFEYQDVMHESRKLILAIELMGKHSNIILYNSDTNVIIGCAHNIGSEKSKERELAGLLPYIYPPRHKKRDILQTSLEDFINILGDKKDIDIKLSDSFYYITMPLVQNLLEKHPFRKNDERFIYEQLKQIAALELIQPCVTKNCEKFSLFEIKDSLPKSSVNIMLDDYFSFHQNKIILKNLKNKLYSIIAAQLKKLGKLEEKQKIQLEQLYKADLNKKKGDLLMSNAHQVDGFSPKTSLFDYETNMNIEIDMDTTLSVIDNANRYYKLYKKVKSSYDYACELIKETRAQIDYYNEQKHFVDISDCTVELEDISDELAGSSSTSKKNKKDNEINIDVKEIDGFKIYLGKNSKQNDYILSKLSSAEDVWFHPLNMPGAHIILKKNNSREVVSDKTLLKVAKLTKEYSTQAGASKVPIIYTLRKYVKKANSKGLAFVTYKNETEILID